MSAAFTYDPKASRARRRAFHDSISAAARKLQFRGATIYAEPIGPERPVIGVERCYTKPIGPRMGDEQFPTVARSVFRDSHAIPLNRGPQAAILALCRKYDITVRALRGPRRDKDITLIRREVCRVLHRDVGLSMAEIGRRLNRDHTTIMHALRADAQNASGDSQ